MNQAHYIVMVGNFVVFWNITIITNNRGHVFTAPRFSFQYNAFFFILNDVSSIYSGQIFIAARLHKLPS